MDIASCVIKLSKILGRMTSKMLTTVLLHESVEEAVRRYEEMKGKSRGEGN